MSYIGNSPGVASQRVTTTITATAGQTQFTAQSGYVLGYIDVYLNGAKLVNGSDFEAITGTYITLFTGALVNDVVELVSYVPRGLSDGYTKAEADAKFLDVGGDSATGSLSLASVTLTAASTTDALRITQTGSGNALLVEDSANPDATPFVVTNTGVIVGGNTSALDGYAGVTTQQPSTFEAIGGNSAGTGLAIFGFSTATSAPRATVNFNKSQSTTIGTQTIVTSNEVLGGIHFNGSDGTNYIPAAHIYGVTDGTPGTNDMPGRLVFSTTADGASTPTERMRIDSTGDVGIGTASPVTKLEIAGSNSNTWTATSTSISGTTMTIAGTVTGTIAIGDLVFAAGIQPYTRITAGSGLSWTVSVSQTFSSANVLGGATYPSTLIRITDTDTSQGSGQPNGALQFFTSDSTAPTAGVGAYVAAVAESPSPDTALVFGTRDNAGGGVDANERMRIDSLGNVGIGTNSPSANLEIASTGNSILRLTSANTSGSIIQFGDPEDGNVGEITYSNSTNSMAFDTNDIERMRIDSAGNVGIGEIAPIAKLQVTGSTKAGGILVESSSTSASAPSIEVIGKRSDGNSSATFSGKILLAGNRTDAAVDVNKLLGAVGFGGNHTDGTEANILYTASISGIAEGTFSNATTMPTGLVFLTGSVGATSEIAAAGLGTERMRLTSTGSLLLGNTTSCNWRVSSAGNITFTNATSNTDGVGDAYRNGIGWQSTNQPTTVLSALITAQNVAGYGADTLFLRRGTGGGSLLESMRIDSSGNVGIGTTSPAAKLNVSSTGNGYRALFDDTTNDNTLGVYSDSTNTRLVSLNNARGSYKQLGFQSNVIVFSANNGSESARIDTSGNLGVGTSSPNARLHIQDGSNGGTLQLGTTAVDNGTSTINLYGATNNINFRHRNIGTSMASIAGLPGNFGTDSSGYLTFSTQTAAGSLTERMRIDSSSVVVGNNTTNTPLVVRGAGGVDGTFVTNIALYPWNTSENNVIQSSVSSNGVASGFRFRASNGGSSSATTTVLDLNRTQTIFYTDGGERARITASGQFLIGGTAVAGQEKLRVAGTGVAGTSFAARFNQNNISDGSATLIGLSVEGSNWSKGAIGFVRRTSYDVGDLVFCSNASTTTSDVSLADERMRITYNGSLLVGKTAPGANVVGWELGGNGNGNAQFTLVGANEIFVWNNTATNGTAIVDFRSNNVSKGRISWDNNSTNYGTTSDYRLKNTVAPITGALAKIAQLKPVTYKWNSDGSSGQGFIAHELAEVCPQAVTGEKDAVREDGITPKYQSIDTSFLVATLTAAIQEQQAIILSLKARLDAANI